MERFKHGAVLQKYSWKVSKHLLFTSCLHVRLHSISTGCYMALNDFPFLSEVFLSKPGEPWRALWMLMCIGHCDAKRCLILSNILPAAPFLPGSGKEVPVEDFELPIGKASSIASEEGYLRDLYFGRTSQSSTELSVMFLFRLQAKGLRDLRMHSWSTATEISVSSDPEPEQCSKASSSCSHPRTRVTQSKCPSKRAFLSWLWIRLLEFGVP